MATSGGQQRLDWYAVPGVPLTLILDTADGSDWPSAPRVLVGPREADGDITPVLAPLTATITATPSRATLTLTDAQMATILTAYPVGGRSACPWHVRLGTGESEVAVSTGYLIWDVTGRIVTTTAQLVVGPPGPTAISADADNVATLGADGLIYVAPGAGTVASVNGETGVVVLSAADVGAAPALGADDNYVTDAEKAALHAHSNKTALDAVSGTNTGDQDLSGLVAKSLVDAKGDLIVATAADTVARLAVGTDDYVLVAASGESAGLKYVYVHALVQTINAQTGTTYTLAASDSGKLVTCSNASAITVTLPQDSDATIPVGSRVDVVVLGAGMVTFAAGTGATANGTPSLVTRAQYSGATCYKRAANTWLVIGDLA